MEDINNYKEVINTRHKNINFLLRSILVGILVGIVVSAYRFVLTNAEHISFDIYRYFTEHINMIPLLFLGLGTAGYLIGLLISKFPMISGSGIPQVKGSIMGYFKYNWFTVLVAKFIGGTIAIIGGLSLGREGPSIQLGACVAEGVSDKISASRTEKKILMASGASAGLAAAFNAPLAGVMFALEETFKYFSPSILLSTMAAAISADFVSKLFFGMSPVFNFNIQNSIPLSGYWMLAILGILLGVLGSAYNTTLMYVKKLYKKSIWLNSRFKIIIPFVIAGVLGLTFPIVLGGGHKIISSLNISTSITLLIMIFLVKFLFSMVSFGSGAPGGIFFPLLILGATVGAIVGNIAITYFGYDSTLFTNFIILAMAGYFTAIVRAPMTGVILLTEMTGSFSNLLSLTFVSIIAYIVTEALGSEPIYESLLESQLADMDIKPDQKADRGEKITFEYIVQFGSAIENKLIKDIQLPDTCLIIAIRRNGKDFIPKGNTKIEAEDYLVLLTNLKDESQSKELIASLTTL